MSPIEQTLRDCGLAAGIGFWRFDAGRGMLHWPRGFGPARDDSYGSWWRLGEFGQAFDPADRARLFDYFENLFEPERPNKPLELPIATPAGRLPLRIEGAPLTGVDQLLAGGLVRNVARRYEAEDRARALGQILDAVLASVAAGVVVLDAQLHVRKANARALQFFGLAPSDDEEAAALTALATRLPTRFSDEVRAAQIGRTVASGAFAADGGLVEPVTWTATPWGRGGMVLVLRTAAMAGAATPARAVAPDQTALVAAGVARARALLDYVHHPCVVIQSRDASIEFANKAARDKLALKPGLRTHINNLFEISGRHAPRNTYVTADRVTSIVTLPMGARVTRMVDLDPDWLFVEYV